MHAPHEPSGVHVCRPHAQASGVSHQRTTPGTHSHSPPQLVLPAHSESAQSVRPSQSSSRPSPHESSADTHTPSPPSSGTSPPPHSIPDAQSPSPQSRIESQSLSLPSRHASPNSADAQQLPPAGGSIAPSHGPHSRNSPLRTQVCVPSEHSPRPRSAG